MTIHLRAPATLGGSRRVTPFTSRDEVDEYFRTELLQCLECGACFRGLGTHIRRAHEMTADEYRARWAIPAGYGLVAHSTRVALAQETARRHANGELGAHLDRATDAARGTSRGSRVTWELAEQSARTMETRPGDVRRLPAGARRANGENADRARERQRAWRESNAGNAEPMRLFREKWTVGMENSTSAPKRRAIPRRPNTFGARLSDMMFRARLSTRQTAHLFGVKEQEVISWKSGEVIPPRIVRAGAFQILGVRIAGLAPDWTPSEDALLGKDTDINVGRIVGRSQNAVLQRRRALGIAAAAASRGRRGEWNNETIALLGTMPDKNVAERVGVTESAVSAKRRSLQMPAFIPSGRPKK